LYVRYGRDRLDKEIRAIFGSKETNPDGSEKEITYGEYVSTINRRALKQMKKDLERKRKGKDPKDKDKEETESDED
jgi:hypothetical protein